MQTLDYQKAIEAPETFRKELSFIHEYLGLSNKELAEALRVSQETIRLWKLGVVTPDIGKFILVTDWAAFLRSGEIKAVDATDINN